MAFTKAGLSKSMSSCPLACTTVLLYHLDMAELVEDTMPAMLGIRLVMSWYTSTPTTIRCFMGMSQPQSSPPSLQLICSATFCTTELTCRNFNCHIKSGSKSISQRNLFLVADRPEVDDLAGHRPLHTAQLLNSSIPKRS